MMLEEYFASAHFDRAKTAPQMAVDMMRAFTAVSLAFPEPQLIERLIRDRKIIEATRRDDSDANRRRLADLYNSPRKEVARIARSGRVPKTWETLAMAICSRLHHRAFELNTPTPAENLKFIQALIAEADKAIQVREKEELQEAA